MKEGFKFRVSKGLGVKEGFRRPVRAPACQCATVEGVSTRPHSTPGVGKKGGGGTCARAMARRYRNTHPRNRKKQEKTEKKRKYIKKKTGNLTGKTGKT